MKNSKVVLRVTWAMVPLALPAVVFAVGVAVAFACGFAVRTGAQSTGIAWGVAAAFFALGIWGVCRKHFRLVVAAVAYLCGFASVMLRGVDAERIRDRFILDGRVVYAAETNDGQRIVVRDTSRRNFLVNLRDFDWLVRRGESVRVKGVLMSPLQQPAVPDEITANRFVEANFICGRVVPDNEDGFGIVGEAAGIQRFVNDAGDSAENLLRNSGVSQGAGEFLCAVMIGRNNVDSTMRAEFSDAGLSHVLALSGTHVSILIAIISALLLPVRLIGGGRLGKFLLMGLLWLYALITGMSPSVVRAVIMATFLLLGRMSGRYVCPFNSLCGAALFILLFDPGALLSVGFQLSFMAVAGILMFMPLATEWVFSTRAGRHGAVRFCWTLLCLPVVAVLATAPLSAWYFHRFPMWFLVANIPVALLLPLILGGGVMLLIFTGLGIPHLWLDAVVEWLCGAVSSVAEYAMSLPGGVVDGVYLSAWWVIPCYATLAMIWLWWNTGRRVWLLNGVICLVAAGLLWPVAVDTRPQGMEWYVWPRGAGVNIVVREDDCVEILTDCNPRHYPEIREDAELSLRDFMCRRGASLRRISGGAGRQGVAQPGGVLWNFKGGNILIVADTEFPMAEQILNQTGVVVVSGGFRGDILEIAEQAGPRTLVLSPSLPPQRRAKYARQLRDAGCSFSLSLSSAMPA